MKRLSIILIPVSLFPLSGCGVVVREALQQVSSGRSPSKTAQPDSVYIASLKPDTKSGEGVVVFEPVVASNARSSAALGTGIGRYLHFHVAGQGAFGKTTTLTHFDEVRRQNKLANWQVAAPTDSKALKTIDNYTKSLERLFTRRAKSNKSMVC